MAGIRCRRAGGASAAERRTRKHLQAQTFVNGIRITSSVGAINVIPSRSFTGTCVYCVNECKHMCVSANMCYMSVITPDDVRSAVRRPN
jgi:hypothetical protein